MNAAGVGFCGDDDHDGSVLLFRFGRDGEDFIGGVADCRRQRVNVGWRDPAVLQDASVESVFAGLVDIEGGERCGRFIGVRQPDLRRPSDLIEAGGFERSHWDAAAEDDNRVRFFERVLDDEPSSDIKKQHNSRGEGEEQCDRADPWRAGPRRARRLGIIEGCGREWIVGEHGKSGW